MFLEEVCKMKVAIVAGSHRVDSQSDKVAGFLSRVFSAKNMAPTVLSLSKNPLPMWDESFWAQGQWQGGVFEPYSKALTEADGVVIVCPEWNGMVTPALKNFFLLCGFKELGHKPGLIVSVSAGRGGAYPVTELRSYGYKNCRFAYMPDHLIVRDVASVLNGDTPENESDSFIRSKIDYTSDVFIEYMKAFQQIRSSGVIDFENHRNGM